MDINGIRCRCIFISVILLFTVSTLFSQNKKDSSLLLIDPSLSSLMLYKLQWEIGYHTSYFSYKYLATPVEKIEGKLEFLHNTLQFTCGVRKNFAVGFDVSRMDNFYKREDGINTSYNFLKIGPRIRWSIFQKQNSNFIVQNYLRLPIDVDKNKETNKNVEFVNQFVLTNQLGNNFLITNQLDLLYVKEMQSQNKPAIILPYTFFLSYFLNTEAIFFSFYQCQLIHEYYYKYEIEFKNNYSVYNVGIGAQLRITKRLLTNFYYRFSFATTYQSAGNSVNFGLRYITH